MQIGRNWDEIKEILMRTKQIPKDISDSDEKHLRQRAKHVKYWLKYFAPDMIRFEVKKKMPKLKLGDDQKKFIFSFKEKIMPIAWGAEDIHNAIYEVSEKQEITTKNAFKTIYQVLLGQDKGPRAGYFLSNLDKDFVLKRFEEAVK